MKDSNSLKWHPDAMTTHLAGGGSLEGTEAAWVEQNLMTLRTLGPNNHRSRREPSFKELKKIYTRARLVQGAIVASRQALPMAIEASRLVCSGSFHSQLDYFADRGAKETERFLTGSLNGYPRAGNDYPQIVKKYISALAGLLEGPSERTYKQLLNTRPDLVALAQDADELQRLSWGHLRLMIDQVVPAEEIARSRQKSLSEGTEELLATVRERIGPVPARVMQRDNWRDALETPRQEPHMTLFNAMKFFVEISEVALLYGLGSVLARINLGQSRDDVLRDHIRHGAQEIAAGTRTVTHRARFQSRIGARPNDYRSFGEFLRNVGIQTGRASIETMGTIIWSDAASERGWCPAQNLYEPRDVGSAARDLADLSAQAQTAVKAWREHGNNRFAAEPIFCEPTPAELFANVVVFATLDEDGPLRPDSKLLQELALRLRSPARCVPSASVTID